MKYNYLSDNLMSIDGIRVHVPIYLRSDVREGRLVCITNPKCLR